MHKTTWHCCESCLNTIICSRSEKECHFAWLLKYAKNISTVIIERTTFLFRSTAILYHSYTPQLHTIVTHHSYTPQLHTIATHHSYTPQLHTIATHHSYTPQLHTIATYHSHVSQHASSQLVLKVLDFGRKINFSANVQMCGCI